MQFIPKSYRLEPSDPPWRKRFQEQLNLLSIVKTHHPELFSDDSMKAFNRILVSGEFDDNDICAFFVWLGQIWAVAVELALRDPPIALQDIRTQWIMYSRRLLDLRKEFNDWFMQAIL